jgi:hypothetical protein
MGPFDGKRSLSRRALLGGGLGALAFPQSTVAQQQRAAIATAAPPTPITVEARRIASFSKVGGGNHIGKLAFRGGLVLTSPDKDFGGFSDLIVEADGRRMLTVSDEGHWLGADIDTDGTAPSGLSKVVIAPLLAASGKELSRKRDADAESMTLVDGNLTNGTVLIGFERNHRIGRFPIVKGVLQPPSGYLKLPADAKRMRSNKGFEALAILQGGANKGAIIAFSERFPDPALTHTGWIWIKGEPQRIQLTDIGDFEVTAAAGLADGSLLILERRFRWLEGVKMRLRRVAAEVVPGAVMDGEVLLETGMSAEIDNMEGLAVHRGERGETVLTLISDDNFNSFLQRTILLQFTLADERPSSAAAQSGG